MVQFVNLFGFYWAINFVTAFGQCTLAGAFASWYFAFKKPDDVPALPLFSAFLRSFWHVGTLAFGSLIIARDHSAEQCLKPPMGSKRAIGGCSAQKII